MVEPLLLERLLPSFDTTRVEHRIVSGDPEAVFEVVRQADFLRAWKESTAVKALFGLRAAAERIASIVLARHPGRSETPEAMRVADMPSVGEWVALGEDAPNEIAFGVIGRFWGGETVWQRIHASEFAEFEQAGVAKIACNFSLRPYGPSHTLVSYEARTRGTDPQSSRAFLRYWRVVSPFVGVVMRSMLSVIENDAQLNRSQHEPGARTTAVAA